MGVERHLGSTASTKEGTLETSVAFCRSSADALQVFLEPRTATAVESTLREFQAAVFEPTTQGALLVCVVGGKLSEGINFADRLGRAVIVVGMPYANAQSPEMVEKLKYLRRSCRDKVTAAMCCCCC